MFDHPAGPWWASGQVNTIYQAHPAFPAAYSGEQSFRPEAESATSVVMTAYGGVAPFPSMEILASLELAAGGGVSSTLGLGGFVDLDVVRNPSLGTTPYLARAFIHQVIPLAGEWLPAARSAASTLPALPEHRIDIRAGKLSTVDSFDLNGPASDSHFQFMNWTVCNDGAYDYAADTRGYTLGIVVAYVGPTVELRYGAMMMPDVANGIDLDTDVAHARGDNLEATVKWGSGAARLLGYWNHARMGSYAEAIAAVRAGTDARPDVTAHRAEGRTKAGVGASAEQALGPFRAFMRVGWNDGKNESFAYTEVDDTVELGGDVTGEPWGRGDDRAGLAIVTNGLSTDHRDYLRLGGKGFLLGDGNLDYGRETIVEAYYNARVARGLYAGGDAQLVANPGYNRDRGPAIVFAVRVHLEL